VDAQALLKRYYSHLIALERRAPLTAQTYRFEIRQFLQWLEERGLSLEVASPNPVEFADITAYLVKRRTIDGIDSRSVAKAVSALKSFFRFLTDEQILSKTTDSPNSSIADRISLLETPRGHKRLPEVLNNGEADTLMALIDTGKPLGIRNRAIYELIYSAGMRISELVSLNLQDLSLKEGVARVQGKGNKERLVVFGPEAITWLKKYLIDVRPLFLGKRRGSAFFISRSGKRLSRKGIWKNYKALAVQAGISSRLHTLRHTFATELLAGGADLRSVQELLGHADLATTQTYTHVDSSDLRRNHQQYLPKLSAWKDR
jgi:integrase/recombinase XerD